MREENGRTSQGRGEHWGQLAGLKVVEFAHVIAGPLAGSMLADMGADVVHVEPPGVGDSARRMGPDKDGTYLWWKVSGRNKRSVTLDLRKPEGREVARRLVGWADVVITTLRSETLERWELDWPSVHALNPKAIMLQVSGFGATTTLRNSPGFGKMGEARSGVVHVTGFPGEPPVHTGFSHGDATTGLMGSYAILAALFRKANDPGFDGEWIDLALFEPLFRLIEWQVIVYDQLGVVPERSGNRLAIAPAAVINTYQSADGDWITVTSATTRSVLNVVRLLGMPEEDFATVEDQIAGRDLIDDKLRGWISDRSTADCLEALERAEVVASRIFSAEDICADPIYEERGDIVTVEDPDLGPVRMQGVVPQFSQRPGRIWRTGPRLGQDNDLVYGEWLGIPADGLRALRESAVI